VPRDRLDNPSLANWFNKTDAWWFDDVRFNDERFESPYRRALALTLGRMVGDSSFIQRRQPQPARAAVAVAGVDVCERLMKSIRKGFADLLGVRASLLRASSLSSGLSRLCEL
jgi:hypothetical protein